MLPRSAHVWTTVGAHMIGRELAGYRIEAQIAQDDVGVVYRALDLELSKPVALKLLRAGVVEPAHLPQFEHEVLSRSALVHPNIIAVLECGVSEGTPFVAMELLSGHTLAERLQAGPLAHGAARKVTLEVLSALAYMHERGFTHSDLRPGNVFLERLADGAEQVKLLDVGLLASRGEVEARRDVQSAAALCFEVLTGTAPLDGTGDELAGARTAPALVHERCAERVARPELERVLQQALDPREDHRQASVLELDRQLRAVPEPWLYEGREATRARRKAALAARQAQKKLRDPAARARRDEPAWGARPELPHKLAIYGAWLLSLGALAIIGITAAIFYATSDSADPMARKAIEQALPVPAIATLHANPAHGEAEHVATTVATAPPERAEVTQAEEHRPQERTNKPARVPAADPWAAPIPRELRAMRWKIEIGQEGDREMLKDLKRYVRGHGGDPRGPLLLARLYKNRDAWDHAITYYKLAYERDPSSRGDPRMLKDLVSAVARPESSWRASELVRDIFGTSALDEIKRALTRTHDNEERLRLEQLAHVLAL